MLESSQRIFSPPGMAEALESFIPIVSRDLSSAIVFLLSVPPACSLPCPFILTPCPSPRRIGTPVLAGSYATRSLARSYARSPYRLDVGPAPAPPPPLAVPSSRSGPYRPARQADPSRTPDAARRCPGARP